MCLHPFVFLLTGLFLVIQGTWLQLNNNIISKLQTNVSIPDKHFIATPGGNWPEHSAKAPLAQRLCDSLIDQGG